MEYRVEYWLQDDDVDRVEPFTNYTKACRRARYVSEKEGLAYVVALEPVLEPSVGDYPLGSVGQVVFANGFLDYKEGRVK